MEWTTNHSTTYQTNTSLPLELVRNPPGKQTCWAIDQKWSYGESFDNYFRNAFENQNTPCLVKLLDEISDDFNKNHLLKVNDLDIFETDGEGEGYENKKNRQVGEL